MKAWVLHGINNLKYEDVPAPVPKDGEVLVKVKAAGICSSDIARVYTTGAYHYPIILGHEFSGVTSDGRRVGAFPLIPCQTCESCKSHHYETCSNYSYIGSRQDGAYAEYVAVPEWNLIELPDHVSFEQAALLEPAAVALHAARKLKMPDAVKAAVIGNGAVGGLIGAWLRHYGIEHAEVLGRNDTGNYTNYDVCVEAAGTSESFLRCVEMTRQNGEIILVGNPDIAFNIGQNTYWKILRKQLTVTGSWNSSYPFGWSTVLENAKELQLESFISHRFNICELDQAFEMMYHKAETHLKVMMVFENEESF